ncbi:Reverse transcriptase domain [Cinara cedri]|uniref:Reverse transcriptase domain n=1 Tax=Cinara cedri TaxID=506608 RepID=A0A5E4NJL4_9HEMI|nr:Reverse transcriptase domain [Cinara cedri]
MTKSNRATIGSCCREDTQMVRCAMIALEKMKDMFKTTLCSPDEPWPQPQTTTSGCALNTSCAIKGCPFRGTGVPNSISAIPLKSTVTRVPSLLISQRLSTKQFSVKINDSLSDLQPISAGVPQGSKMAPILFNIYISDIPQSPRTNMALFADDTIIYSESRNIEAITHNLQCHLNVLSVWCKNWKIQINASKSTAIIFSLRLYSTPPLLKFDKVPIPWEPTVKYLGITLDKRLTRGPHLSAKIHLAYQRLSILFPIINKKQSFKKNVQS